MHNQLARLAAASLACLLVTGCITAQMADETSLSPEQRMIKLAGDVEARGDQETAMALYARAAETSGNAAEAQLRLGHAQMKVRNYAAASEAYGKVLATEPEHPEALLGLGTAKLKSGDNEGSARTLGAACPLVNTSIACNRLGTALILVGRLDEALAAFDRAQALAPNDLDIKVNIALVQALSGRTNEAVTAMRNVAQSPIAQTRHRANLVIVLGIAGRLDEAKSVEVPGMSQAQKQELLARAKRARDATNPVAKARAIGLFSAV